VKSQLKILSCLVAALALAQAQVVSAQSADNFPSKPVTIIANVAAGGPTDIEARLHSKKMTELLGQTFIVDYKPGASGNIGAAYVARAKPDGYTVLVVSASFTILPAFMEQPFDVEKDFSPITVISQRTSVLVVNPAFPAKNIQEYVAYARANPGKINFGWVGPGVVSGALLHSSTNTRATFIPYKGTAPIMNDLVAGRLDVSSATLTLALPLIKAGKLRPLGTLNDKRTPLLPEVPTIKEQGVPDFNVEAWLGYLAPAQTPSAIVNKLSQNFARTVKSPEIASILEAEGNIPWGTTPEQFRQIIANETGRWRKLAKETGLKLQE